MTQYTVTGMSCASCQAHVEKAVSKVPGVKTVSVSLLTNSMGVEGTADSAAVIAAVEKAGYGASLREESAKSSERSASARLRAEEEALKDHTTAGVFRLLPRCPDVHHHGAQYVGMAAPGIPLAQSSGTGADADASGGGRDDHQQGLLHFRLQVSVSRGAEHGCTCGTRLERVLRLVHLHLLQDDSPGYARNCKHGPDAAVSQSTLL